MTAANSETDAEYFAERGFELRVEERDLHAEHMARGEPGRASFYVEGRRYYCVQMYGGPGLLAKDYAHGDTVEAALAAARRRFGSEQA